MLSETAELSSDDLDVVARIHEASSTLRFDRPIPPFHRRRTRKMALLVTSLVAGLGALGLTTWTGSPSLAALYQPVAVPVGDPRYLPTSLPDGYSPVGASRLPATDFMKSRWIVLASRQGSELTNPISMYVMPTDSSSVAPQTRTSTFLLDGLNYFQSGEGTLVIGRDLGTCGTVLASGDGRNREELARMTTGLKCDGASVRVTGTQKQEFVYDGPMSSSPDFGVIFSFAREGRTADLSFQVFWTGRPAPVDQLFSQVRPTGDVSGKPAEIATIQTSQGPRTTVTWQLAPNVTAIVSSVEQEPALQLARAIAPVSEENWNSRLAQAGLNQAG